MFSMILQIFAFLLLKHALGNRVQLRCPDDILCHNNGICNSKGTCVCKQGWTGKRCEVELCPLRPCANNGYCDTGYAGHKFCRCDRRFQGEYCESDKNECVFKPCPADAVCINHEAKHGKDKGYSCLCPTGYTGDFCEVEVDLCEVYEKQGKNYCYNGGICKARFVCVCEDGCPVRPEVCAKLFDNGSCDEFCNRESCLFDGFDCAKLGDFVCRDPSKCAYKYGDGNCDAECAGAECGFDGGDCNDGHSVSHSHDVNMIGIALEMPPEIAVKNLRHLQAVLAQRLYTHVNLAKDVYGVMIYEWSSDRGQGDRVDIVNEQVQATAPGSLIFFDVDTTGCRLITRKNYSGAHCFTDLRAAATYLTVELTRSQPVSGETLPIRDVTWKRRQMGIIQTWNSLIVLPFICIVISILAIASCTAIIIAIVRIRRRRQKRIFAPCWKVPGVYHPPTPPYSQSPESNSITKKSDPKVAANTLTPIIDAESQLLSVVRRGDLEAVKQMISSKEIFVDALFERNASGQSPLVFAARMSHPGLECVSILVASIDAIRKRRRDDSLSDHFSDIGKNRKDLLKLLPLYDEADIKYALTDSIGRNVLHYAALYNAPHLVNYFATCGANVNLIDNNGDAPIHLAAKGGNVEALLALLNNNCDVNIKDALDRTAYSIANNQGHSVICDLFHSIASTSCV